MTDISFIATCYNEEKHVIGEIKTLQKVATILELTHEILVFNDASMDGTSSVVKASMQQFSHIPAHVYQNKANKALPIILLRTLYALAC
ncbi:glycosyltransferase family 2 protein [Aquicella lusitana]|uniref:Glycosyltransferase 2-like domain-containing protein n=1 Tax=Aquicella lusitana TaxID=254246 RepID=A0A370GXC9_9COXI|nr:glycosyltransferase [Aquicella lusitana]RDI48139.1 hypothetical protein C8D86_103104 [Aquicella lusitana]VVC72845.1 hypothetical protein AQULUS_05690 [Aquicella lusitana]